MSMVVEEPLYSKGCQTETKMDPFGEEYNEVDMEESSMGSNGTLTKEWNPNK